MDERPCSCGGENSSCFKCDGTGLLPAEYYTLAKIQRDAKVLLSERIKARSHGDKNLSDSYNSDEPKPVMPISIGRGNLKSKKSIFGCLHCKVVAYSEAVLRAHMLAKHAKSKYVQEPKQYIAPEEQIVDLRHERERSQDGSANWHAFRDHGQFGSYPSFDSMDDE